MHTVCIMRVDPMKKRGQKYNILLFYVPTGSFVTESHKSFCCGDQLSFCSILLSIVHFFLWMEVFANENRVAEKLFWRQGAQKNNVLIKKAK